MFPKMFITRKFKILICHTISSFSSLHTVQSTYVKVTHRKYRIILLLFCTKLDTLCTNYRPYPVDVFFIKIKYIFL